jgi:hypothetical protein
MLMILDIYNELSNKERGELQNHLKSCPTCAGKYKKLQEEYSLLKTYPYIPPEFNWNESWRMIKTGISRQEKPIQFKAPMNKWLLRTAAIFIIFILGFISGRLFFPPTQENSLVSGQTTAISLELKQHFENVETAILEYANYRAPDMGNQILMFEKKRITRLLSHNRLLKKYLQQDKHLFLKELLDDIEIILLEVANLKMNNSEYMVFIKDLLQEKDIIFKIKYFNKLKNIESSDI